MVGPSLAVDDADHAEGPLDLDLVFGARRASRFGTPIRAGRRRLPAGQRTARARRPRRARASGRAATSPRGARPTPTVPARARRPRPAVDAWDAPMHRPPRTVRRLDVARERGAVPARPMVPGERRYRDGDRVRHARFGDGIVVTARLTRDDEEVTVAFRDPPPAEDDAREHGQPRARRLRSAGRPPPCRSIRPSSRRPPRSTRTARGAPRRAGRARSTGRTACTTRRTPPS